MELGPIFRALLNNATRFWLIALEVALTLAVVTNCVTMILDYRRQFARPTGLDEENILVITTQPFGTQAEDEDFINALREDDLRRLRSFSGVNEATTIDWVPLGGGGSITSRKPIGASIDEGTSAPYFVVGDRALQTLGVELIEGRDFIDSDFPDPTVNPYRTSANVIITQDLADQLFPDGDALGEVIESDSGTSRDTIVGIIRLMHNAWPRSGMGERVMLRPGDSYEGRQLRYIVRCEPGAIATLYTELEELMYEVEQERIVKTRSLEEYKRRYYDGQLMVIKALGAVILLLIAVTAVGVIGMTSFSVTQRTREIGTRRALGATRAQILRHFLVENWVITTTGLLVGAVLTLALNYALGSLAGAPKIDAFLLVAGALILWTSGILAALAPALRATTVAPEIATRTV